MRFRPCIDIHNGKVKQIVGGSLRDEGDQARENFVAGISAADYARLYGKDGLKGGHIILLNPQTSEYYDKASGIRGTGSGAWLLADWWRDPRGERGDIFTCGSDACHCDFICISRWTN